MSDERLETGQTAGGNPVDHLEGHGELYQDGTFQGEVEYNLYFTEPGPEDPQDRPVITGSLVAPLFWSEQYTGTLTLVVDDRCFDFVFGRKDTNEIFGTSGFYPRPSRLQRPADTASPAAQSADS